MQLRQKFFEAVLYKNVNLAVNAIVTSPLKDCFKIMDEGSYENVISELESIAKNKALPRHFRSINNHLYIDVIRSVFGYGLANAGWLDRLSEFLKGKKAIEVMAGNGIISGYLQCKGNNVLATDNNSWGLSGINSDLCFFPYTSIENIGAVDAVRKYGGTIDYIIMSWPPFMEDVAYNVLQELREINPKAQIIYIGEYRNGCCANDKFFNDANNVQDSRLRKINQHFQKFCTTFGSFSIEVMHDSIYILK